MNARILGLDPGDRRIGVAIADPTGTIASPDRFIDTNKVDVASAIKELCEELEVALIVVGLPLSLDGHEGPSALAAREFGASLERATGIDVVFQDERFTTKTAEDALISGGVKRNKRKLTRDQVAAAVMLQNYLDRRRNDAGSEHEGEPLG